MIYSLVFEFILLHCSSNTVRVLYNNWIFVLNVHDTYGELTQTSGTSQTVFGYTGEETDANGLVNLRARYYNPTIGQFFSLDPLEGMDSMPMSLNRYAYVQGNVVNWVDPSGMYTSPNPNQWDSCGNRSSYCECLKPVPGDVNDYGAAYTQCLEGLIQSPCTNPADTSGNCKVFVKGERNASGSVWENAFPFTIDDPGDKSLQADNVEKLTANCGTIQIVGYSGGADSTIIFAHRHAAKNIKGLALLGPTLTGAKGSTDDVSKIWQQTLATLVNSQTRVYVLNDDSQQGVKDQSAVDLNALFSAFEQSTDRTLFQYDYKPNKLHYTDGPNYLVSRHPYDPSSTNNDATLVQRVVSWFSASVVA